MIKEHPLYLRFLKNRYRLLLIVTVIFLIIPAFMQDGLIAELLMLICLSFLFIQSLMVVVNNRRNKILGMIGGGIVLLLTWYQYINADVKLVSILQLSLFILFFGFIISALIRFLLISKKVTMNIIIVAVTIYLLAGITGGAVFYLIEIMIPGAFAVPAAFKVPELMDFIYYSFVTMTTLGYGDMTPVTEETQVLSFLLAIIGQFYVAVIMAILVSKFVSNSDDPGDLESL